MADREQSPPASPNRPVRRGPVRRVLLAFAAGMVVLAAIIGVAWIYRVDLANTALQSLAAPRLPALAESRIVHVDHQGVEMDRIAIGSAANGLSIEARGITLAWTPTGLTTGSFGRLQIAELRVQASGAPSSGGAGVSVPPDVAGWTVEGIDIAALTADIAQPGLTVLTDGRLTLDGPVTVEDLIRPGPEHLASIAFAGQAEAEFSDFTLPAPLDDTLLSGRLTADASLSEGGMTLRLESPDGITHRGPSYGSSPLGLTGETGTLSVSEMTLRTPWDGAGQALDNAVTIDGTARYRNGTLDLTVTAQESTLRLDGPRLTLTGISGTVSAALDLPDGPVAISAEMPGLSVDGWPLTGAPDGPPGRISANLVVVTLAQPARDREVSISQARLQQTGPDMTEVALSGFSVAQGPGIPAIVIEALRVTGDARAFLRGETATELAISATGVEVLQDGQPVLAVPLASEVRLNGHLSRFDGTVSLTLPELKDMPSAEGRIARNGDTLTFDGSIPAITFAEEGFQPGSIAPMAVMPGVSVDGALSARWQSDLDIETGGVGGTLYLDLRRLGVDAGGGVRPVLSGIVMLDLAALPSTVTAAELYGDLQLPGLDPAPMTVTAGLRQDGTPEIDRVELDILGGIAAFHSIEATRTDAGDWRFSGEIDVTHVSLDRLAALLGVEAFAAQGSVSGTVPFTFDDGGISLGRGTLRADVPGTLRYTGENLAAAAVQDENLSLLADALEDFQYRSLALNIDIPEAGSGVISMNIKGSNPAVLDGRPFDVTINLESDYAKLIAMMLDMFRQAEVIMRGAIR